jgi:Undecaprenyl-phosphate galactose phosphotransferase WbaP
MAVQLAHPTNTAVTDASCYFRSCRARTTLALLLSDLVAWGGSAALATWIASALGVTFERGDLLLAAIGLVLAPLAYAGFGLYPAAGVSRVDEFRRLTYASSGVWLVLVATVAMGHGFADVTPLVATWALALPAVPVARGLLRHLYGPRPWFGVPVVVLGAGRAGALTVRRLQRSPNKGYKPVALFDDDPARIGTRVHGVPVVGPLEEAVYHAERGVRHAIVAIPSLKAEQVAEVVRGPAGRFPNVILLPEFAGMASVGVTPKNLGGLVGLHVRQELLRRRNHLLKRALDLALLVSLGLVAVPIVAVAALWVRRVSPGSPFYAQEREGRGGRTFRVWKLRTMHHDADALLERHLADDPAAAAEWATKFKLARDPRILPGIGQLLRKTSLDELPQLWNILRGEMSFVGPRPFPAYHLDAFDGRFRALRREVLPGLTGLWQVVARADADLALQEELDTLYIANWSLWMDLYLIARTPWSVLRGTGAY